jgi:peroxiredoxin
MGKVVDKVTARSKQPFELTMLADPEHKVIDLYGLLNDEAAAKGRYLPHPTTYVIDKSGQVRWKFTEVNYKVRPTNGQILKELEKLEK